MAAYAEGRKAFGFCDRCGFRYDLKDLKSETVNLSNTNILSCPECWSPDQPQNMLGRIPVADPQALRNPRPLGGISGRLLDGTVSYDFEDNVDGFTATNGSLSHNASDETVTLTMSVSGATAYIQKSSLSLNSALYRYARMRFRFLALVSNPAQTLQFSWRRSTESSNETPIQTSPVDLYVNGSDWHEISWDMEDDKNTSGGTSPWTGTVSIIKFEFLSNDPDSTSSVEVDWIRIEPGYLGQGT